MWWPFILPYVSRLYSFLNGEKLTYGSSRKVKQQFSHRKIRLYLANFEQNILFGTFQSMNYHLIAKYKTEKVFLNKVFSNFNLQKHHRILFFCLS